MCTTAFTYFSSGDNQIEVENLEQWDKCEISRFAVIIYQCYDNCKAGKPKYISDLKQMITFCNSFNFFEKRIEEGIAQYIK